MRQHNNHSHCHGFDVLIPTTMQELKEKEKEKLTITIKVNKNPLIVHHLPKYEVDFEFLWRCISKIWNQFRMATYCTYM